MKLYMRYLIVICFMLAICTNIHAQQEGKKYAISLEPNYLFNGGLRVNFEKQLSNPAKWVEVGLTGYITNDKPLGFDWDDGYDNYKINSLKGAGINVGYKHLFYRCFFYNIGASYTYYKLKYDDYAFIPYQEDNLTFYKGQRIEDTQNFNKLTLSTGIGITSRLANRVFFEMSAGIGYAHSFYNEDKPHFDNDVFSLGYRGVYPQAVMRIGILLGK